MALTCPATGNKAYFSILDSSSFESIHSNFQYLSFDSTDMRSAIDENLPIRHKELLFNVIDIIDDNVRGLYKIFMDNHRDKKGLTEVEPLLNSTQRKYFTQKDGLIDRMRGILENCSKEEIDFIFHNLMGVEKEIQHTDISLKFTQHFLQYKQKPEEHKLLTEEYRIGVMTAKGIRPDTRRHRIATTKQLMYHGIFGMLVDSVKEFAAKIKKYPQYIELYGNTQKVFDREKLHRQKLVYDIATGKKNSIPNIDMPQRNINSQLNTPDFDDAKKIAALIDINVGESNVETEADVNINSSNGKHLLYFRDYENKPIYAVSHDTIPMCGENANAIIFSTLEQASTYWKQ